MKAGRESRTRWRQLARAGAALVVALVLLPIGAIATTVVTAEAETDSLQLDFAEPMLTWQQPQSSAAIRLSPPVDCRWYWEDATTLRCESELSGQPLLAHASKYQIELGEGLWTQAGTALPPQRLTVSTTPPQLSAALDAWDAGEPVIALRADQPVETQAVREVLRLHTPQGQALPLSLEPQAADSYEPGPGWLLRVDPAQAYSGVLSLSVQPGLRAVQGPLRGMQRQVLLTMHRREPFQVYGIECGAMPSAACLPGSTANLRFSRPPDPAALAAWLPGLPAGLRAGALRAEALRPDPVLGSYRPAWSLPLEIADPQREYTLVLPAGFAAADGSRLADAVTVAFRSGDYPPTISSEEPNTVVLPGAKLLHAGSYRNAGPLKLTWRSFGADSNSGSETLPAQRDNRSVALPLPTPRALRRSGGLVSGDFGGYDGRFQVIHAPFQLAALYVDNQLLVWTGAWDTAVQQDIELEIFQDNGQQPPAPLARGRTAADGTALIDVPELLAGTPLLLRARRGNQFSVLPLSTYAGGARGGGDDDAYMDAPQQRLSWGVSDRPLYRPGERVQYRLWLRRREGNQLKADLPAGPALLRLQSEWGDEALPGWQAEVDAVGSASGELQIPAATVDGRYCIVAEGWPGVARNGLCFDVVNYHATPLWARVEQVPALAELGDDVAVDVAAGYYSGGPAAAAQVELSGFLRSLRLETIYPQWKDYRFLYSRHSYGGFGGGLAQRGTLDAQGRLQLRWRLSDAAADDEPDAQAAFGELALTAAVSTSPAQQVASAPVALRVSRYRRFVGLKLDPVANAAGQVELSAVLIDAAGHAMDGDGPVEVSVQAVQQHGDKTRPAQGHCVLALQQPARCDLAALPAGMYTFTASHGDAAPASLLHALGRALPIRAGQPDAQLQRLPDLDGKVRLQLQQPYAKARVLFALQHQRVLRHWVAEVSGPAHAIELDLPQDWAPGVTLTALVLDAELRRRPRGAVYSAALDAAIDLPIERPPQLRRCGCRCRHRRGRAARSKCSCTTAPHRCWT
jgi:MG2 domain